MKKNFMPQGVKIQLMKNYKIEECNFICRLCIMYGFLMYHTSAIEMTKD